MVLREFAVPTALARARHRFATHPEMWLYTTALLAAATLMVLHGVHTAGHASAPAEFWPLRVTLWTVMVAAMMLPVVAPLARRVAVAGLWRRRYRSMCEFVLGYLAVWAVFGVAILAVIGALWPIGPPPLAATALFAVAALWQVSRSRRRVMRRCGAAPVVALRGWPAARGCVEAGWIAGVRCVLTCGPAMVAMTISDSLVIMAGLTCLLLSERARGPNPATRPGRPIEAWGLVGLGILSAAMVWMR